MSLSLFIKFYDSFFLLSILNYYFSAPVCYGEVDIVFTVDASFSIADQNFRIVREFLLELHTKMQVDLGPKLRTGIIFYAKTPYTGDQMIRLTDDQRKIGDLLKTFTRVGCVLIIMYFLKSTSILIFLS